MQWWQPCWWPRSSPGAARLARTAGNPTANGLPVDCGRACLIEALEQVLSASFAIFEAFQIERGKIDQVWAMLATVPSEMHNAAWPEGDRIP